MWQLHAFCLLSLYPSPPQQKYFSTSVVWGVRDSEDISPVVGKVTGTLPQSYVNYVNILINLYQQLPKGNLHLTKYPTTHCKGGGASSRRIIMWSTAAFSNNASNWGGKGGCLGFFVYLCSLEAMKQ